MEKSLEKQRTMCDMVTVPGDQANTDRSVGRSCTTYNNMCRSPEKREDGLYSFDRWQKHNEELLSRSVKGHHHSNVVEYNVQRAINTLSASVDKSMVDSTRQIAATARNIERWKADIFQALESTRDEIKLLLSSKRKIQKAQTALRVICSINAECLARRTSRLEADQTLDPGQAEIVKEKNVIAEAGDSMCLALRRLEEQLARNERVKYRLEENWSDKEQSFRLDVIDLGLNIQSPIITPHADVVRDSENACLTVTDWEKATKGLYDEAAQTLNDSKQLRSIVDHAVLEKSSNRLRDQADAVDMALARFVSDTQQVGRAIENDLEQVVRRLGDSENLIGDLLRVISNLEKAKMTAETRLYNRLKRPVGENCKDSAQLSIVSEVENLREQLKTLNYQLDCARTGHLGLQEVRSQLEDEARVKRKTLWIDIVRCQKVRAHYPSQSIMIGH